MARVRFLWACDVSAPASAVRAAASSAGAEDIIGVLLLDDDGVVDAFHVAGELENFRLRRGGSGGPERDHHEGAHGSVQFVTIDEGELEVNGILKTLAGLAHEIDPRSWPVHLVE